MTESYDQRAAEQWFRRRGLPSVVRGHPMGLLVRIVPGIVFVGLWELMAIATTAVDGGTDAEFERRFEHVWFKVVYVGLLIGLFAVPALGAWLVARWVRRQLVDGRGRLIALAVIAAFVFVLPILSPRAPVDEDYLIDLVVNLVIVGLIFGLSYLGGGSITGWALRAAFRQARLVGTLTGRALPLLLLFTVFGFMSTELWQIGGSLSRARVWGLCGLFAIVTVLFLTTMITDEVQALDDSTDRAVDPTRLHDTPFAVLVVNSTLVPDSEPVVDSAAATSRTPLGKLERFNMILVLVLTQVFQAAVIAGVTFVFFVIFGVLAVKDSVIKSWLGRPPEPGQLFGVQIPLANELLHVSMVIAAFSALYFAASTVTDPNYRKSFFQPLTEHLAVSLSARDLYLAQLARPAITAVS